MNRAGATILLPLLLLVPAAPGAAPPEPGEKWEQTVEMEMEGMGGMKMPPTTLQFCRAKDGWDKPPSTGRDEECEVKDFERSGNRVTWKVVCKGDEPMTGEGELTYTADSFSGRSTVQTASGTEMNMKMKGRRLGGACDAGEERRAAEAMQAKAKKQVAQGQAQQRESERQQAEFCTSSARKLEYQLFKNALISPCKDPKDRALLCSTATSRDGLMKLHGMGPDAMEDVSGLCKKDLSAASERYCEDASVDASGNDPDRDALAYVGAFCPVEARAIAKKQCAGRSYTGMPSTYRGFCTEYASREGSGDVVPAKGEKGDVKKEATKKVLKGLFGR